MNIHHRWIRITTTTRYLIASTVDETWESFIRIATLPYYRLYHFSTRDPLNSIAKLATELEPTDRKLLRAIRLWRTRKLLELQFITLASAVLAAAVIGAFSWTSIAEEHWLTHGLWFGTLVLAILGILLSASETTVLHLLGQINIPKESRSTKVFARYEPVLLTRSSDGSHYVPLKKMIFTWQCPMMFMAYSATAFLAGLTVMVCAPLVTRNGEWNYRCNIAVTYISFIAVAGPAYIFCSYWVYHYVDLDFDASNEDEGEFEEEEDPHRSWDGRPIV